MAEVRKGANKQSSDEINKGKDQNHESIRDNNTTSSVNTFCIQQTKLSSQQSIDPPLTSVSDGTTRECIIPGGSMEKYNAHLRMNGHNVMESSLESLDDASHVAVVNQNLYNNNSCRGYMKGEVHFVQDTGHKRVDNLFSALDFERGYSSSQVEEWV